jgi:LPS O-antigen subunit length determinant protein (WzzB/FepE family)
MTNPVVHAFFVGRALAQGLNEQLEKSLVDALSELGKFDAEQRERIRAFADQVIEQANQDAAASLGNSAGSASAPTKGEDLQELLDNLRAEIAQLRTKLQEYRDRK